MSYRANCAARRHRARRARTSSVVDALGFAFGDHPWWVRLAVERRWMTRAEGRRASWEWHRLYPESSALYRQWSRKTYLLGALRRERDGADRPTANWAPPPNENPA